MPRFRQLWTGQGGGGRDLARTWYVVVMVRTHLGHACIAPTKRTCKEYKKAERPTVPFDKQMYPAFAPYPVPPHHHWRRE